MEWLQMIVVTARNRIRTAGPVVRTLLIFLAAAGVAVLVWLIPYVRNFSELFRQASSATQSLILLVLLALIVSTLAYAIERAVRVEDLKDAKAQADTRREAAEKAADQLQERWDHLLDVECRDVLWKRPCAKPTGFVPRIQRNTRFLTVLNLKGGVGKTTLTGNLAAALSSGTAPLRVLLIDIDFQGTLSDSTVHPDTIRLQHQNESRVNALLETEDVDPKLLTRLAVPMNGADNVDVILANDTLDAVEFQLQARFFLDANSDPRFRFCGHLHQPGVLENYDLVIFDCPPRVTTSVVNAVVCSDYILIPTKLDDGSIDAVPRTVDWVRSLGVLYQPEGIGVVASHSAVRSGGMVKADQESYAKLRARVESSCGADCLFESHVPASNIALPVERGRVASTKAAGRELYAPVVSELRKRMKL